MRKVLFFLIIFSISCSSFRKNTIPVAEVITSKLEDISKLADVALSGPARQNFAKLVMIPAINSTQALVTCLETGKCKNITAHLTVISGALLVGINNFVSSLPASSVKTELLDKLNNVLIFVTQLHDKLDEIENSQNFLSINSLKMVS